MDKFKLKKHTTLLLVLCFTVCFVIFSSFYYGIVVYSSSKCNGIVVVIDAGHGGRDGGSVGVNGTIEKEINLDYAYTLKNKLTSAGYLVEMTRTTDDGLYSALDKNKKQSDMNKRCNIIKKANPNLVVSIHMNSFKNSSASGASTYYRKGDTSGEQIANLIQKSLHTYCNSKISTAKVGDYYILNSTYYTAVLVECGFISNPTEEALLNTTAYKNKIIDCIYDGILLYFGNKQ